MFSHVSHLLLFLSFFRVLPTDIAGEYAGLLHGLSVSTMTFGLVLNPILMSLLVPNQVSLSF